MAEIRPGFALAFLSSVPPQKHQPRAKSPSGGRAEVLRRGTSRMDAARGVMGQGWPMYAGPRSSTGGREVERSETRMQGRVSFAYFSLHAQRKVRRPRGRNTKHQRIRWCAERLCNSRVMMGTAMLNLRGPTHPTVLLSRLKHFPQLAGIAG